MRAKASLFFSTKIISVFSNKVIKYLTRWPLNKLDKLSLLWTTGPRIFSCKSKFFSTTIDLLLEELHFQGRQTGSYKSFSQCKNGRKKIEMFLYILIICLLRCCVIFLVDFRLNPSLMKRCKLDIPKFCKDINIEEDTELEGKVIHCLKQEYVRKASILEFWIN